MSRVPYADSNGQLSVEVSLKNAANVFLVDSSNFRKYQNRQQYSYHGGYYTRTPVTIRVYGAGRWYLIVEGAGQYQYRFY
ncbi:DUF1883 domain-containing protein [Tissierella creatinophila]|uniref:DUF1883 domain-containing protein n=1 Tax=Tissierella creatinophila DSM 6911 TaxID=1123403 RepID=A0A1U7M6L1_TISCR|nr:DUF1883 domain-containing protein [Tissierella creatinophila]OLS02915.1 hypothetical protein TICRE_10690 [Tissierella creatinophila DSM 6911]